MTRFRTRDEISFFAICDSNSEGSVPHSPGLENCRQIIHFTKVFRYERHVIVVTCQYSICITVHIFWLFERVSVDSQVGIVHCFLIVRRECWWPYLETLPCLSPREQRPLEGRGGLRSGEWMRHIRCVEHLYKKCIRCRSVEKRVLSYGSLLLSRLKQNLINI